MELFFTGVMATLIAILGIMWICVIFSNMCEKARKQGYDEAKQNLKGKTK